MTIAAPAEVLLQSLGITEPKEIDLEAIAYDQGATVRYRRLGGCEARIVGVGNRAVISVDDRTGPARRRFSVAHELGHWHFHRGRSFECRPDDIGNPRRGPLDPERVADGYAADLLMPRYLFVPRANALGKVTVEAADTLSQAFETSLTSTAIRLVEYGPEPALLVCHSRAGRRWFCRNRHVPSRWFPREDLDADSLAFDVLHGDVRRSRRAKMGADAWFDRRDAEQYEVIEQSMKVSNDEILIFVIINDATMLDDA